MVPGGVRGADAADEIGLVGAEIGLAPLRRCGACVGAVAGANL